MEVKELESDVLELQNLLRVSSRSRVKQLLENEISATQNRIADLKEKSPQPARDTSAKPAAKTPVVQLNNYGWDQSDQFMKIYVTDLKGVHNLTDDQVQSSFNGRVCHLVVNNLAGKTYKLDIGPLFNLIVAAESKHKVKTDMVILMLKKAKAKETWPYVIEKEKKEKPEAPSEDELKDDPQAGLMNMLKKMYDDGDDEMKRTIAKSWEESRNKQSTVDM